MIKKTTIAIVFLIILGVGAFFLVSHFSKESSRKIEIKSDEKIVNAAEKKEEANDLAVSEEKVTVSATSESEEVITPELPQAPEKKEEEEEKNEVSSNSSEAPKIRNKLVSWGYEKSSGRKIDTVIMHTSYDSLGSDPFSVDGILKIYKSYGVAAHYIISREGEIIRLVEEKSIAYHAGESRVPDGRTGVNAFSIGIELVNTKKDDCTSQQYKALKSLVAYLKSTYKIKYVLGHDDIAPGRKDDPWGFEWGKL